MPTFEEQLIREFHEKFPYTKTYIGDLRFNDLESFLLQKTRQVRETTLKEVGEMVEKMECTIKKDHPEHCHYPIALLDLQNIIKKLQ